MARRVNRWICRLTLNAVIRHAESRPFGRFVRGGPVRIRPVADSEAREDPLLAALFEATTDLVGTVPNSIRTYARLPEIAIWLLPLNISLQLEGAGGYLDGRTKQLVALTTSLENECAYCVSHNDVFAAKHGLTSAEVEGIRGPYPHAPLSSRDAAVVRWVRAVTKNEAARDGEAFSELQGHFDEPECVEVTWLCGLFNMLNRVHDALQIEHDTPSTIDSVVGTSSVPAVERFVQHIVAALEVQREMTPYREY